MLDLTSILPPLPVEDEESKRKRLAGQQKPVIPAVQPASGGEDYSRLIHPFVGNTREGEANRQASMMKSAAESVTPPSPMATPVNLPPVGGKIMSPQMQGAQSDIDRARQRMTAEETAQGQHHGRLRSIFEGIGNVMLPGLMQRIPGTMMHHQLEAAYARGDLDQAVQNAQRQALTQKELEPIHPNTPFELELSQNPNLKAEDWLKTENANKQPPLGEESKTIQTDEGIMQWNPATKRYDIPAGHAKGKETSFNANEIAHAKKLGIKPEDMNEEQLNEANRGKKEAATIIQPQRQMMYVPNEDGSMTAVEVKPGSTIPKGAKTQGAVAHDEEAATADEKKKADLVTNAHENLAALRDIARRRPELFGPLAGKVTSARAWAGTSDPDIAKLAGIKDRFGMVNQGLHSMRSASHVAEAGDSVLNHMNNSADATIAAIDAAEASLSTFQRPIAEQRGNLEGNHPQGGGAQPKVGDTKKFPNGRTAVWDGHGWAAQ